MSTPFYLRGVRKQSELMQSDIGYLLNERNSKISRIEKGKRMPSLEMLVLYHVLFDIPLPNLFEKFKGNMEADLISRLNSLIVELKTLEQSPKVIKRIALLTKVYAKLTASLA